MFDFSIHGVLLNLAIDFSFIVIAALDENRNKYIDEIVRVFNKIK